MLILEGLIQLHYIRMVQLAHDLDLIQDYCWIPHVFLANNLDNPQIVRKDLQPGQINLAIRTLSHFLTHPTLTLMNS